MEVKDYALYTLLDRIVVFIFNCPLPISFYCLDIHSDTINNTIWGLYPIGRHF